MHYLFLSAKVDKTKCISYYIELWQAGYDPRIALAVSVLNLIDDNEGIVGQFLAEHPTNIERLHVIADAVPQVFIA